MKRKTLILWLALFISAPATFYSAMSVIFYSWLNAAEPERWPVEKATIWAGGSLLLTIIFFSIFVYSIVSLVKMANIKYREQQNKT